MHQSTSQGPESTDFPHAQQGLVTSQSVSLLSDSEPVRFVASGTGNNVTATLTLTAACKHVIVVEVLHCE